MRFSPLLPLLVAGLEIFTHSAAHAQIKKAMPTTEYQSPNKPVAKGLAPGLQSKLLSDQNGVKPICSSLPRAMKC